MRGTDFIPNFAQDSSQRAMPTLFELFGLRFFFFSDDHAPIHVHVVKGDDDAKIALRPEIRLVYNTG